ncbi:hypothetical protein B0H16DRAFT_1757253 [Mycena metata]|uniref:Uncharacterized protein n=1 Tax=Mycena metata TaxID=1033252 RepID=A0AAD7N0Z1_9AGAR|nr:hypothetical protein B0H16DRAFT_1757253 [Mycena metata]
MLDCQTEGGERSGAEVLEMAVTPIIERRRLAQCAQLQSFRVVAETSPFSYPEELLLPFRQLKAAGMDIYIGTYRDASSSPWNCKGLGGLAEADCTTTAFASESPLTRNLPVYSTTQHHHCKREPDLEPEQNHRATTPRDHYHPCMASELKFESRQSRESRTREPVYKSRAPRESRGQRRSSRSRSPRSSHSPSQAGGSRVPYIRRPSSRSRSPHLHPHPQQPPHAQAQQLYPNPAPQPHAQPPPHLAPHPQQYPGPNLRVPYLWALYNPWPPLPPPQRLDHDARYPAPPFPFSFPFPYPYPSPPLPFPSLSPIRALPPYRARLIHYRLAIAQGLNTLKLGYPYWEVRVIPGPLGYYR